MLLLAFSLLFYTQYALGAYNRTVATLCPTNVFEDIAQKDGYYFGVAYDKCYFFVTYERATYEVARDECVSIGGSLAMPKTITLNDFLLSELRILQDDDQKRAYWIGMHDKVKEGDMVWEDGTAVDDWGNFDKGLGSFLGAGEDCVALDPKDGKWHDYGCSNARGFPTRSNELPYICEFPVDRNPIKQAIGWMHRLVDG